MEKTYTKKEYRQAAQQANAEGKFLYVVITQEPYTIIVLEWEDEEQTIPSYEPIYDYVDKTDEDMTDEDVATLDAIAVVRKALDKLV